MRLDARRAPKRAIRASRRDFQPLRSRYDAYTTNRRGLFRWWDRLQEFELALTGGAHLLETSCGAHLRTPDPPF